ncbi:MAG: radical SAM protein [Labilithrix sp.]|nr:radical SAM protein [Labilithrix sp.]
MEEVTDDDDLLPVASLTRTREALSAELGAFVAPGELFAREGDLFRCTACAHRCVLSDGRPGACGVRERRGDAGLVPFGYVARRYVRNVETNTVYHVVPGAKALTFGMYGCDLRCPYCHNWKLSQALRDGDAAVGATPPIPMTPAALVDEAVSAGCRVMCAAYNEPMIAAEWVRAVFGEARARGLFTMIVSDGNTTPEALAFVRPVTDVYRVDLKGFSSEQYKALGGRIEPVLAAIAEARRLGFWVEVVTLVVPGFNDDPAGLRALAKKLLAIDPAIPWHLNAFQPRYKMRDRPPMHPELLVSIAGAALARGMKHVYVGNVTGMFGELEHTRCPKCHFTLVERRNYQTTAVRLDGSSCPACREPVAGLFTERA